MVGYGLGGQHLSHVLRDVKIPYRTIDLDGDAVRRARKEGEPIIFGDVTRREILELAAIEQASVIVIGISDPDAARRAVRYARQLNPAIHVIVRTHLAVEIDELYELGADDVFADEFEASIEIFTRVLEQYHVPSNVIQAQRRVLRGEKYEMFRDREAEISQTVLELLARGAVDTFLVSGEHFASGKTLRELDVRRLTGATVIVVVRENESHAPPNPNLRLEPDDFVVITGGHVEVDAAFRLLTGGIPPENEP